MCVSSCYIFLHHSFPLPPVSSHTLSHTPNTNPNQNPKSPTNKPKPVPGGGLLDPPAQGTARRLGYVRVCVFMCLCLLGGGGKGGRVSTRTDCNPTNQPSPRPFTRPPKIRTHTKQKHHKQPATTSSWRRRSSPQKPKKWASG